MQTRFKDWVRKRWTEITCALKCTTSCAPSFAAPEGYQPFFLSHFYGGGRRIQILLHTICTISIKSNQVELIEMTQKSKRYQQKPYNARTYKLRLRGTVHICRSKSMDFATFFGVTYQFQPFPYPAYMTNWDLILIRATRVWDPLKY